MYRCDHQLDAPFTVQATDKDMDPFAGPFKFDLADHSRSMTQTWQVKQVSGEYIYLCCTKKSHDTQLFFLTKLYILKFYINTIDTSLGEKNKTKKHLDRPLH